LHEKSGLTAEELLAGLRQVFADVPRPGLPKNYVPTGRLGNPGWDEFTYHSAVVLAEQIPDHVRRALDSPADEVSRLLWHLSDSERLGVFSARQLRMLVIALDFVEANCEDGLRDEKTRTTMATVRRNLERLLERPE